MAQAMIPARHDAPPAQRGSRRPGGRGQDGNDFEGGGFGSWDPLSSRGWSIPPSAYQLGMWLGLGAVTVFFASLSTVLAFLHAEMSRVWMHTPVPRILYLDTSVLLASSVTLELARRSLSAGRGVRFSRWLKVTLMLGLTFVGGQVTAWRQLASTGVYLHRNPSSAFLYAVTFMHGMHLAGGAIALIYLVWKAPSISLGLKKRTALDVTTLYWHFMDGLWIYLLGLILFAVA